MDPRSFPLVQAGERTNGSGSAISNKILLNLPAEEFGLIRPHLKQMDFPHHLELHEPNKPLDAAYFPNHGLISVVVVMDGQRNVEAGLVGREGSVGTPLAFGLTACPLQYIVQLEGDGLRLESDALRELLPGAPQLQYAFARFSVIQGIQIAQTAACNRLHPIEQRLARWLLMAQDRVDEGWLAITHDFLATMLGTDRPSVTLAAGQLQDLGTIEYVRGAVRVVNRKKLEESACECYRVIERYNGELGIK